MPSTYTTWKGRDLSSASVSCRARWRRVSGNIIRRTIVGRCFHWSGGERRRFFDWALGDFVFRRFCEIAIVEVSYFSRVSPGILAQPCFYKVTPAGANEPFYCIPCRKSASHDHITSLPHRRKLSQDMTCVRNYRSLVQARKIPIPTDGVYPRNISTGSIDERGQPPVAPDTFFAAGGSSVVGGSAASSVGPSFSSLGGPQHDTMYNGGASAVGTTMSSTIYPDDSVSMILPRQHHVNHRAMNSPRMSTIISHNGPNLPTSTVMGTSVMGSPTHHRCSTPASSSSVFHPSSSIVGLNPQRAGDITGGVNWGDERFVRANVQPIDCNGRLIPLNLVFYLDKPLDSCQLGYLRELWENPQYYEYHITNGYPAIRCKLCNKCYPNRPMERISERHTPGSNNHQQSLRSCMVRPGDLQVSSHWGTIWVVGLHSGIVAPIKVLSRL